MSKSDLDIMREQVNGQGGHLPPVDSWNPSLSGEMDLRIARDGTWHHEGRAIVRTELVRLFSTILRRDADEHYYLVTPVEKWRIQVDDAPFLAVELKLSGSGSKQHLIFRSNLDDWVAAGDEHPIEVEYSLPGGEPAPYVHVRGRLWALLTRSVFIELAELAQLGELEGEPVYGVWSQGVFFPLGPVSTRS